MGHTFFRYANRNVKRFADAVIRRRKNCVVFICLSVDKKIKIWYIGHIERRNKVKNKIKEENKMGQENIKKENDVPIWEKYTLSIEEASIYFRIGVNRLRDHVNSNKSAPYILWVGSRPQIKRLLFEKHVDRLKEI